ncbi:MAG: type II toxin-antitoxin system VapC family toxin [bacterium]|nr:type II toxin-antitoxin system VapC family toxin [bacterium]
MNYLLDTHVFLWSIMDSKKLSKKVKNILTDIENNILISVITYWEISLKYNIGKLSLNNIYPDDLPEIAARSGFENVTVSPNEVSSFYKLPIHNHKDPFDRLIIWQAIKNEYTLISKDTKFDDYTQFSLKVFW